MGLNARFFFWKGAFAHFGLINWESLKIIGISWIPTLGNLGRTGGGGIIRDYNDFWILGFAKVIGIVNSVEVKLWALRDGIRLCIKKNLLAVEVELDAKVVVEWMFSKYRLTLY